MSTSLVRLGVSFLIAYGQIQPISFFTWIWSAWTSRAVEARNTFFFLMFSNFGTLGFPLVSCLFLSPQAECRLEDVGADGSLRRFMKDLLQFKTPLPPLFVQGLRVILVLLSFEPGLLWVETIVFFDLHTWG